MTDRLRPWFARAALLLIGAACAWGVATAPGREPVWGPPPPAGKTDVALYRAVIARVAAGEHYVDAAATEHRLRGFPLRPVFVVRPPALATLSAALGPGATFALFVTLAIATFAALALRVLALPVGSTARVTACAIAALATGILIVPEHDAVHDIWAGLLVALALALHRPGRWVPSLVACAVAALIRELAFPALGVIALLAWIEGRKRESLAAIFAAAVVLIVHLMHWRAVAAIPALASDVRSPGWQAMGGWTWIVQMYTQSSVLTLLPLAITSVLIPLALAGWWVADTRIALWLSGMTAAFTVFGRPDNPYWGGLVAMLVAPGVAFAPTLLARLWLAARPPVRHAPPPCKAIASS